MDFHLERDRIIILNERLTKNTSEAWKRSAFLSMIVVGLLLSTANNLPEYWIWCLVVGLAINLLDALLLLRDRLLIKSELNELQ